MVLAPNIPKLHFRYTLLVTHIPLPVTCYCIGLNWYWPQLSQELLLLITWYSADPNYTSHEFALLASYYSLWYWP